ncbi:hypothetical protein FOL47_006732 [Perkinsus chesapeaki]|uniref:C3H1-type domain-containing protein n=1 Tax=Perkinsus chesapeaki TaxID=330153 RepID=A0A7J6LR63_PERCH|nr:hypothetical protein FOL47_006732 [Perkinsus chesapeaki]
MARLPKAPAPYYSNTDLPVFQLQPLVQQGGAERNSWDKERLHKTKMCTYFLRGKCKFGKECSYAHGSTELQARPNFYKTKMCNKPKCNNWACPYAHSIYELRDPPPSTNTIIKPDNLGRRYANKCPLVHVPSTTTTGGLPFIGSSV